MAMRLATRVGAAFTRLRPATRARAALTRLRLASSGKIALTRLRHPLVGVLLLASLVRAAFFAEVHDEATFTVPLWDSAVFDETARRIARGDGSGWPGAYYFGPLYAYVLGFVYFVTGNCSACAVLVQHALGVLVVGLTYALARTWFGRRESLLSALVLALLGVQLFYEGKLLMEVWVSALVLASVLILARLEAIGTEARKSSSWLPAAPGPSPSLAGASFRERALGIASAGLLLGLAALGRPTVLLLAPLVLVPLLRLGPVGWRRVPDQGSGGRDRRVGDWENGGQGGGQNGGQSGRQNGMPDRGITRRGRPCSGLGALVLLAVYVIGLGIPSVATLVRNHRVEGVWVPITASGGFNFYLGNARDGVGALDDARVRVDSSWNGKETAEAAVGRELDSAELSRYWFHLTAAGIRSDPAWWLGHYLGKVRRLLGSEDIPQIECYSLEMSRSRVLRSLPLGLPVLMLLATAGAVSMIPRLRLLALLYGPLLLYVAGVSAFFVTTRYRVVALPYLAVFSAIFLGLVWDAARGRAWRRLLLLSAIAVGAAWFTLPAGDPDLRARRSLYALHLHDGFRLTRAGELPRAVAAYLDAQQIEPDDYEGYLGLGITYREQGDLERSIVELGKAMDRNRVDAEVPYHLGVTLHNLGRYEEAEGAQRASLRLSPRRALTRAYLGVTLAAQGRFAEARTELEESVRIDPGEPFGHNNLGALLGLGGDHAGARQSFLRALEVDPDYIPARRNLAQSFLEAGDVDRGVRELQRVLAQDPEDEAALALLRSMGEEPRAR